MTRTYKWQLFSSVACFLVGGTLVIFSYFFARNYVIGVVLATASALVCEIADYLENKNFSCLIATPVLLGVSAGLAFIVILIQMESMI